MDDSTFNAEEAKLGVRYVKGHLADLPTVVLAREGRVWGVFRPFQQLHTDLFKGDINVLRAGLIAYWLLAAFAVGGVIVLRRRLPELVVLGSFIASLIVTTAVTYGTTRFRAPADVAIVLLAAVAVDTLIRRASRSKARTGDTIRQPVRRAGRRSSDRPTGAVQS
jgi:hypothetical protein